MSFDSLDTIRGECVVRLEEEVAVYPCAAIIDGDMGILPPDVAHPAGRAITVDAMSDARDFPERVRIHSQERAGRRVLVAHHRLAGPLRQQAVRADAAKNADDRRHRHPTARLPVENLAYGDVSPGRDLRDGLAPSHGAQWRLVAPSALMMQSYGF
jgi:hypothetical protein